MPLSDTQELFKAQMLAPASRLGSIRPELKDKFIESGIAIEDRFKVYHNNVVGNLTEILRNVYPVCENLTGEDFFKSMARNFIFQTPPKSGCMLHYGSEFPFFIKTYKAAESVAYLHDMAQFEWNMHKAYYAEDAQAMNSDVLSKIDPDMLSEVLLPLHPSTTIIQSCYPLQKIRDFCLSDGEGSPPNINKQEAHTYLIVRSDLEVQIAPLEYDEFTFLCNLQKKKTLAIALDSVFQTNSDFDFSAFLQKHLSLETFLTLDTEENS